MVREVVAGNNFKLLRLLVAYKVVVGHAIEYLEIDPPVVLDTVFMVVRWFPGVAIFFAMSGYLLARSLDRPMSKADLLGFGRNRGLRILPALWICTLATFVLLAVADLLFQLQPGQLVAFVVAQMTIGQSWSPGAIAEYGLSTPLTPNPALWTIRMSIAFYVALPLVLVLGPRLMPQRRRLDAAILALAAVSWCVFAFVGDVTSDAPGDPLLIRLIVNSPAPYLWLLMVGILFYRYEAQMKEALVGQLGRWLAVFLGFRAILWLIFEAGTDEKMPLAFNGVVQLLAIAPAFALGLSPSPLLKRVDEATKIDLSYSVYLWHMVFVNAIIHWDLASTWVAAAVVLAGSTLMAKISWHAIEAPALARKRRRPAATQPVSGPPGYAATS